MSRRHVSDLEAAVDLIVTAMDADALPDEFDRRLRTAQQGQFERRLRTGIAEIGKAVSTFAASLNRPRAGR